MVNKSKIAMIAAVVAMGIVTPALADGVPVIPQYSLPGEAPGFGNATVPRNHQPAVRNRTLYNSTVIPNNNAANDPAWSTTGRQNEGH